MCIFQNIKLFKSFLTISQTPMTVFSNGRKIQVRSGRRFTRIKYVHVNGHQLKLDYRSLLVIFNGLLYIL